MSVVKRICRLRFDGNFQVNLGLLSSFSYFRTEASGINGIGFRELDACECLLLREYDVEIDRTNWLCQSNVICFVSVFLARSP